MANCVKKPFSTSFGNNDWSFILAILLLLSFSSHHSFVNALSSATTARTRTTSLTQNIDDENNIIRAQSQNHILPNDGDELEEHNISPISIPWLIVGGGIHGVHIAARLLSTSPDAKPSSNNTNSAAGTICIVDDNECLLQKWKARTSATGMEYLRSSAGYHLDLEENSLRLHFGVTPKNGPGSGGKKKKKQKKKSQASLSESFTRDYERPRLDLFNQHCDSIVNKYELEKMHAQGSVRSIEPNDNYVRVEVSSCNGKTVVYEAGNVVLALGNDEPAYPDWVNEEDIKQGLVRHLLDDKHRTLKKYENERTVCASETQTHHYGCSIAIIGGGITAVHKALELVRQQQQQQQSKERKSPIVDTIHLISRHSLREQQFDTHQDWMMDRAASKRSEEAGGSGIPKRQRMFANNFSWEERRKIIAQERVPGTVTPAVNRGKDGLCYAIQNGTIQWHQAEVLEKRHVNDEKYADSNDGDGESKCGSRMELTLSCGETIEVDEILLATGFGKKLPGGQLIQRDLIEKAGLEVSDFCGFPIVNENLQWHPRIYAAGALAELELGPSARNIAGARLAAERILQSIN